ncbi:MAG: hypothetical protein WDO70_00715 [Alphaproteobacteria bacterium]
MPYKAAFLTYRSYQYDSGADVNNLHQTDDDAAAVALRRKGFEVTTLPWGEPVCAYEGFDLLVFRSTWDYLEQAERFHDWLGQMDALPALFESPISLIRWNLDKAYLLDLAASGAAVIPVMIVKANETSDLPDYFRNHGALVIKPAIACGGKGAYRILSLEEAEKLQAAFSSIRGNEDYIIQPYMEDIKRTGEWELIFIDGRYTHAVLKKPPAAEDGWKVQEAGGSIDQAEPPLPVLDAARNAFSKIVMACNMSGIGKIDAAYVPLYARIDLIGGLVSEIELFEPSLYFSKCPANQAAELFAAAALERVAAYQGKR